MSPEYLEELADIADSDCLWKLPLREQLDLPEYKRRQLDAGIAIRRYASHIRDLRTALDQRKSLLITPLSSNGTTLMLTKTPVHHANLREARESIAASPSGSIAGDGGGNSDGN